MKSEYDEKKISRKQVLICFIVASIFITLYSKSSFLYPLNDWGDTNCYFMIGKGILKGKVPYRDMYDQKGIMIFLIYALAAFISKNSFLGVYIIEIICATLFLYFSLKIVSIFYDNQNYNWIYSAVLGCLIYTSGAFRHGGSAEELLLPTYAYGLYIYMTYVEKKEMPSNQECFMMGFASAIIFWSKFPLCIFYIVIWFAFCIYAIYRKEVKLWIPKIGFFLLGVVVLTVSIIIYFWVHGAIQDLLKVYFYDNIFVYNSDYQHSHIRVYCYAIIKCLSPANILNAILIFMGTVWSYMKRKQLLIFEVIALVMVFFMQMMNTYSPYYLLPLFVFECLGLCFIAELCKERMISKWLNIVVILFLVFVGYEMSSNRYLLFAPKDSTPQYRFTKEMEEYQIPDYKMLVYENLDEGFYFAANKDSDCRAFIQTNMSGNELIQLQNEYVYGKKADFIITRKDIYTIEQFEKEKNEIENVEEKLRNRQIAVLEQFEYELIDQATTLFEEKDVEYKLYKKIEEN